MTKLKIKRKRLYTAYGQFVPEVTKEFDARYERITKYLMKHFREMCDEGFEPHDVQHFIHDVGLLAGVFEKTVLAVEDEDYQKEMKARSKKCRKPTLKAK